MTTDKQITRFIERELLEGAPRGGDPLAALDSLSMETLIAYLSDHYGITFNDEDTVAENFSSVTALASLVDAKRAAGAAR